MSSELTLDVLQSAVDNTTAAIRLRAKLGVVDGDGGKIFPPTYAGGIYAVENRRIDGQVRRCVLLDSVQSQANRMEELLQDAFLPNWREMPVDGEAPQSHLPVVAVHVENHGWITSLTAPHRIHDAILRDSNLSGTRFRESEIGAAIVRSRIWDATALYRYCPTALLFGTWDSTAGEGLDSAKIPRAVVSEIIGVDMNPGVRTGSRIDPLGIKSQAATIYRRTDGDWALQTDDGGWIGADGGDIDTDSNNNPNRFGKGKPSDINHGNVTPDLSRFGDRREVQKQHLDQLPDILQDDPVSLSYEVRSLDGELRSHGKLDSRFTSISPHAVRPGGVTVDYALHTWTLSLTQLRRLRFPGSGGHDDARNDARNKAARTVLAALGLYALALQQENGYWLRSRCELIPDGDLKLELVGGEGGTFKIGTAKEMRQILVAACQKAQDAFETAEENPESGERNEQAGETEPEAPNEEASEQSVANGDNNAEQSPQPLPNPGWEQRVIWLTPTEKLAELVRQSDARRVSADTDSADSEETASVSPED